MGRKRSVSKKTYNRTVPRKAAPRRRNSRWVALIFVILLIAGVVGTLVFQGGEGTSKVKPISTLHTDDFHSLMFSPDNPEVVYFGHHDGIMRSDDGGRTWRPQVSRTGFDAMSLVPSRNDSKVSYLAGHEILQVSRDGGVTWSPMKNNLPGSDIHAFSTSLENTQRFYAYIYGNGVFRSDDGGLTWEKISSQLSDIMAIATSGGNPETLFAGTYRSGAFRSTDGGKTWVVMKGLAGGIMSIAVDTKAPKTVYAGGNTGLYKSTDGGDSWTQLDFPGNNIAALAISPTQPGLLLVINVVGGTSPKGDVYRSEDGGITWVR